MGVVISFLLAAVVGFLGYRWYKLSTAKQKYSWLKSVPGWPILGNLLEFGDTTEVIDDFMRLMKKHGKFIFLDFATKPCIFATDYDFLEFVLSSQTLINKSERYKLLHLWLGTGLLTSGGRKWKKMRRLLTPAFHFSILEQFVESFESNGQILIKKMEKLVGEPSVDIYKFINLYTLDVICDTAMGVSFKAQQDENSKYVTSVRNICKISVERAFSILKYSDLFFLFHKDYKVANETVNYLHSVTYTVMDSRREVLKIKKNKVISDTDQDISRKKKKPFLDILLDCTTDDGEPVSREDIREEVDTFMFEGHDTTASAISFCLYLLANHPEVQKKALEEQQLIFGGDIFRNVTYNDLQEMKYLECVIKETLRLYPSVPIFTRTPEEDCSYKGNIIPKNTSIVIFAYGIMRDPDNFPDPERFDPCRFERYDGKRPYYFIPFSAGPRNCIGQKFAMLEIKCTLSKILRNFVIHPATPKHKLKLAFQAVLKSTTGVKISFEKRKWYREYNSNVYTNIMED